MARLKIGAVADDTPVKLTVLLPAAVHRDLLLYAQAISKESGEAIEAPKLIGPMLLRFMATDRVFTKWRRSHSVNLGMSAKRHSSETPSRDGNEQ
jgi:hypothetical protein